MVEMKIASRSCADDLGRQRTFHYYLTVDQIPVGQFCCEDYGVRIDEEDGDSASVPSITTSPARIDELMTLLVDNLVVPVSLEDVIDDWK